jgi:hypothetical protein
MTTLIEMVWKPENVSTEKVDTPVGSESRRDATSDLWIAPMELEAEIRHLFALGKAEIFESGIDSDFSRYLYRLINKYGDNAIASLSEKITRDSDNLSPVVAGQTLKLLGEIENQHLRSWIFAALIKGLKSKYVDVKDGAILGLASLDDPKAIPHLEAAIEHEQNRELREDMEQILEQLIETHEEN